MSLLGLIVTYYTLFDNLNYSCHEKVVMSFIGNSYSCFIYLM